jgi:hypothetical protein
MAIIPGKQKVNFSFVSENIRKQRKMIWILLFLVVTMVVVYFLYINNVSLVPAAPTVSSPILGDDLSSQIVQLLKPVSLDIPLFKNKRFQLLILPGDLPIVTGEKGRENPFEPF